MVETSERCGRERWMRRVAVLLAVIAALVLPVLNPGSGTAVNFQHADDVAAAVRADHHAKPLPPAPLAAAIVLLVGAVAAVLRHRPSLPIFGAVRRQVGFVELGPTGSAGHLWARPAPVRRGPPALV